MHFSIFVTEEGMFICRSEEQLANANDPIEVTEKEIITFFKKEHP